MRCRQKVKYREIRRFYVCVTCGGPSPKSGIIKGQILKKVAENKSYVVKNGGKDAETHYRVLKENGKSALCEVEIISANILWQIKFCSNLKAMQEF